MVKRIVKYIFLFIIGILFFLLLFLSIFEYKPEDLTVIPFSDGNINLTSEKTYSILSWNIGYAGLGKNSDFFMSGGKKVRPSKDYLYTCFDGIVKTIQNIPTDIVFLQEVDIESRRSRRINQFESIQKTLNKKGIFALNYKCPFVPFPFPPIGKVECGIASLSNFKISTAHRHSLPVLFKWPFRLANLKRCFLETRLPIYQDNKPTGKELILVNFHLEAFDNGQAKIAQTKQLMNFLNSEYAKGNYVIAGGDFNQTFPGAKEYPFNGMDSWVASTMEASSLQSGWSFCFDDSVPSCRSTAEPYVGKKAETKDFQFYLIDGFIRSPNVEVTTVKTIDKNFEYSDHNPIYLEFRLK